MRASQALEEGSIPFTCSKKGGATVNGCAAFFGMVYGRDPGVRAALTNCTDGRALRSASGAASRKRESFIKIIFSPKSGLLFFGNGIWERSPVRAAMTGSKNARALRSDSGAVSRKKSISRGCLFLERYMRKVPGSGGYDGH